MKANLDEVAGVIRNSGCTVYGTEVISPRVAAVALGCDDCKFDMIDDKGSLVITPFFNWRQITVEDVSRVALLWCCMYEYVLVMTTRSGKSISLDLPASDAQIAQAIARLVEADESPL